MDRVLLQKKFCQDTCSVWKFGRQRWDGSHISTAFTCFLLEAWLWRYELFCTQVFILSLQLGDCQETSVTEMLPGFHVPGSRSLLWSWLCCYSCCCCCCCCCYWGLSDILSNFFNLYVQKQSHQMLSFPCCTQMYDPPASDSHSTGITAQATMAMASGPLFLTHSSS